MSITAQDLFARQVNAQTVGADGSKRDTAWIGNADLGKTLNANGISDATVAGLASMFTPRGGDKIHEFFKRMHADIGNAAKDIKIEAPPLGGAIGSHGGGSNFPKSEPMGVVIGPALDTDHAFH